MVSEWFAKHFIRHFWGDFIGLEYFRLAGELVEHFTDILALLRGDLRRLRYDIISIDDSTIYRPRFDSLQAVLLDCYQYAVAMPLDRSLKDCCLHPCQIARTTL